MSGQRYLVCVLVCAAVVNWVACPKASAAAPVLVLRSRAALPYDEAIAAFVAAWKTNPRTAEVRQETLPVTNWPAAVNPAAVVAVGTEALQWAQARGWSPVVFCMVANPPVASPTVHGISLNVPVPLQFQELHRLLPQAKRVGVLYDPAKSAAAVAEAEAAAQSLGLTLVKQPVATETDLPAATAWIAGRIDVLWAPVDATVFNAKGAAFVIRQLLQRKVPVMGFSENMVKAGALLAPRVNYAATGRQAAELLGVILSGHGPRPVSTQPPGEFEMVVNRHISRLIGRPVEPALDQRIIFVGED